LQPFDHAAQRSHPRRLAEQKRQKPILVRSLRARRSAPCRFTASSKTPHAIPLVN
jgi:hypothetical protein